MTLYHDGSRRLQDRFDTRRRPQCSYQGGEPGVGVEATGIFPNCPRYIHEYRLVQRSRFVPHEECSTPVPAWKTRDWAKDVLRGDDPASESGAKVIER
jgi:hypothetical protein